MQSKTTGSVLFPILFGFSAIAGLIVCVGLACSNVFSILFSFALGVMPTRQNEVSALMIMDVSGGALLTPVMGLVADQFGQVAAFGLLGETTMGLLQSFTPKADCPSIVVYNTLNWTYSGLAKAYIDHQILPRNKAFEIVDAQGTIKQLYDKELDRNLLSDQPEWEMGEFIYEIIDSRRPMELSKHPSFCVVVRRRCVLSVTSRARSIWMCREVRLRLVWIRSRARLMTGTRCRTLRLPATASRRS